MAKVAVSLEYDDKNEALRTDDLAVDGTATGEIADERTSERATNASWFVAVLGDCVKWRLWVVIEGEVAVATIVSVGKLHRFRVRGAVMPPNLLSALDVEGAYRN